MTDETTSGSRLVGERYALIEQIGRGGMAEVWSARDARLGRTVAIKLLRTDLARDPSFQARFKREAQSSASLNHPAIVSVYDTGEDVALDPYGAPAPQPYIVMEQVRGRTVKQLLQQSSPIEIDDALRITAGVLDALQYSHRAGIIHRDIKPANVMVTDAGEVKVMDFGIARALADTSATMTGTNAVLGTAQYLSPEQARGETVDIRSDLYSAGCLLYELLAGRPPFVGENALALAYQHVGETPQPPSSVNPDVPADLDTVVLHALAKTREERYQDAEEFVADLDRVASGLPVVGPGAGGVGQAAGAAGALGAVAGAGAVADAAATSRIPRATPRPAPEPQWGNDTASYASVGSRRADGYDEEPPRGRVWLYALLVLAALGVIAAVAFLLTRSPAEEPVETARMPSVVGTSEEQARLELETLGFTDITTEPQEDTNAEPGEVIEQFPTQEPDPIPLDTAITLTVASGPGEVEIPPLVDLTQVEARNALAEVGLEPGIIEQQDDPIAESGLVLSSSPAAGTQVAGGSDVDLVLASGQNTVPAVVGETVDVASQQLTEAGFVVATEDVPSEEAPGTVIDQGDTANQRRAIGQTITLSVAVEPPPPSPEPTPTPSETEEPSEEPDEEPDEEPSDEPGEEPSG